MSLTDSPGRRIRSPVACAVILLSGAGCGPTCDRDPDVPPTRFTDGVTDLEAGVYETAPWEGPFLSFPAGQSYLLVHGLGTRPSLVSAYLSFDERPLPPLGVDRDRNDHSNVAENAGNQVVFEEVTDEHILVRNDTCSPVWLRVVAVAPVASGATATGGM